MIYLSVTRQGREVEEQGLAKRHGLEGIVQIVALAELHLWRGRNGNDFDSHLSHV